MNQQFLNETHQIITTYIQRGDLDAAYALACQAAQIDPIACTGLAGRLSLSRLAFDEALAWSQVSSTQDTIAWCAQAVGMPNMTSVADFIFGQIRANGLQVIECYVKGRGVHAPDPYQGGLQRALQDFYILYEVRLADSRAVVAMTRAFESNKNQLGVHPRLRVEFTAPDMIGLEYEQPLPGMLH